MMIPMTDKENGFKPYMPEKEVTVTIYRREAILLSKLRKIAFGKVVIHKVDGKILRFEPTISNLIDEDQDFDL